MAGGWTACSNAYAPFDDSGEGNRLVDYVAAHAGKIERRENDFHGELGAIASGLADGLALP